MYYLYYVRKMEVFSRYSEPSHRHHTLGAYLYVFNIFNSESFWTYIVLLYDIYLNMIYVIL